MAAVPFSAVVADQAELRRLYRNPPEVLLKKKVERIDAATAAFIATAPFCLLATADADGRCDVSPRGGPPGFVRVLDGRRLALPDLSGNNILDSLTNVLANPHVGLLFVVPGRDETLRLEGNACLTTDPDVLGLWDDELRTPKVAIGIELTTAYIHCAKSFRRGKVWDPASWAALDALAPDACAILVDNLGLDLDPALIRADLEKGYEADLTGERAGAT
ncbi:MAG: pyridoxamine 5'-phosphate oxidase family protein [Actinomycetota bacterium]|nr:pyridoxamine 5'-phosphate oxidase family protein [Acidimicrobiia bacterium]MDQ3294183.1 pyridoxamine 5'-phosphate oxidase family protein [Actinomycetota bacterium]